MSTDRLQCGCEAASEKARCGGCTDCDQGLCSAGEDEAANEALIRGLNSRMSHNDDEILLIEDVIDEHQNRVAKLLSNNTTLYSAVKVLKEF